MTTLKNLDLNLLKAFHALMTERSVSKAAERLAITQPAMSGTLARLRESFDAPLFLRTQRGITPTNRAIALAEPVARLLDEVESLLQPAEFTPQTAQMTVSIACTDYAMRAVVVPFLRQIRPLAPHIKVAIHHLNEADLPTQLAQGKVDFGLVTPDFAPPDVHSLALYDERYVGVMSRENPLAEKLPLSLDDFCQATHALVSYQGGEFVGITDKALAEQGLSRNVAVSVQNFLLLPELLQNSDLIATIPERLLNDVENVVKFEPPIAVEGFTKTLVWHAKTHRDPAYQWLREQFLQAVG